MVIIIIVSFLKINASTRNKKNANDSKRSDEEAGEWNVHRRSVEQRTGSPSVQSNLKRWI